MNDGHVPPKRVSKKNFTGDGRPGFPARRKNSALQQNFTFPKKKIVVNKRVNYLMKQPLAERPNGLKQPDELRGWS